MPEATYEGVRLRPGAQARRIPGPDEARPPLKSNVFTFAAGIASQLQPMFPYEAAGNLVPCVAVMQGIADGHYGHFFHWNSVEEIAVVFGSKNGMLATGSVFATQQLHGVNSFLKDPADPDAFILITITQRQAEDGDQSEAILFRCQKCSQELVNFKYNATPRDIGGHDPAQWGGRHDDKVSMFPTLWGSATAADQYNESEASRTCSGCGHVNPEFPQQLWGWRRWVAQQQSVNASKRALAAAADDELHRDQTATTAVISGGPEGPR
jgi:hypothetical protein